MKRRLAGRAFDGEGARLFGGRWNSPGRPAVYVSESRALATLEVLAGLTSPAALPDYVLVGVAFDLSMVRALTPAELPEGWDAKPPTRVSQQVGDRWLEASVSAVLRVPSVIVPAEANYLLNPRHPDFSRIEIGASEPLDIDPRLLS